MDTIVPAGDPAAVVLYSELTYAQAIRYTTASKLMAVGLAKDDPSNFVQFFEETADKSGDTIKYDLIYNPFGPGIAGDRSFSATPLPGDFTARLAANRLLFPRGVDLLLVSDNAVAALPRTTRVSQGVA